MPTLWMINQYAIPPDLAGGTRHYDFAREFIDAGWNVRVFSSNIHLASRQVIRDLGNAISKEETCYGVPFVWIKTEPYSGNNWKRILNMAVFSRNLLLTGKQLGEKPDIIMGSSPNLFAAYSALILARRLDTRFVLEVRDLWPQTMIDMGYSSFHPLVLLFGAMEKILYRKSARIVVLAEGSAQYLTEQKSVPAEIISFIPNGVSLDTFKPSMDRDTARKKFGIRKFTCAYVGAHGTANALETVLDAAEHTRHEEIDWLLVGDGPEKKSLQEKAGKMNLDNLRFLDPIPKTDIPDLLVAIDAAVICLRNAKAFGYAISPNKLFDYMASSCPILCAIPGQMAALVEESGCGLAVTPEDGKMLGDKAVLFRGLSFEERSRMGHKGKQIVEERYSRQKLSKLLIDQFKTLGRQD